MWRPPRPHRPPGPGMVGPVGHGPGPRRPRGPPPGPPRPLGPLPGLGPPMPGMRHPTSVPSTVSSCTNSTDPASMDSRLFVGNLNTLALNKEAIEAIFSPYGLIMGISMHKGYAFVQYRHPDEARHAGASEDGKNYAGQAIDINIVSQPKNRNALKRPSVGRPVISDAPSKKTRSENSGTNQSLQRTLVTLSGTAESSKDNKRAAANNAVKRALATVTKKSGSARSTSKSNTKKDSSPPVKPSSLDILICGTCKLQFASLNTLAQHKQYHCQLRISTTIVRDNSKAGGESEEPSILVCATCESQFSSAWSLCLHCTEEHELNIYKTKVKDEIPRLADNGDHS